MPLNDAVALVGVTDEARDVFVDSAERALDQYHAQVGVLLTAESQNITPRLNALTTALLYQLVNLWLSAINGVLEAAHQRVGVLGFERYGAAEAQAFIEPGVRALASAALATWRTNRRNPQLAAAAWERQYERGGAFVALRGTMRGSTAGTLTTLANASLIDTLALTGQGDKWILGAYNPLDERTADLDRQLCLNRGDTVRTNRGRVVTSIPGLVGKYTLANAWVPGPPRMGGDTHQGCRCWLLPERRE